MAAAPSAMIAYEMYETVLNQPTTFQLRRRKNIAYAPYALWLVTRSFSTIISMKNRVTKTAVISENAVPQKSVYANPLTVPVPSKNSTPAPTIVVKWLSKTDENARAKPILVAERSDLPDQSSSLMRSKISTLASTAIPIESTKPAMPGSVSTACATASSASSAMMY